MHKIFLVLTLCSLSILFCSCSSIIVTDNVNNALKEMDKSLVFHNKKFMEERDIKIPDGINEKRFDKLPFDIGIEQNLDKNDDSDILNEQEFNLLKITFANAISATNRFPMARVSKKSLADKEIREDVRTGVANASELDVSEMKKAEYIINVKVTPNKNYYQNGNQGCETFAMTLDAIPMQANNNAPLSWFPAFKFNARLKIWQKVTSRGFVAAGIDTTIQEQRNIIHNALINKLLLVLINHIYSEFPAGGEILELDPDSKVAVLKASRATGLLKNMEMVIYARKRGNPNAMRVPLYNATLASMGQEGSSELNIWRANTTKRAINIIKAVEQDWESAREEYDFFAASSGLAEAPDFIKVAGGDK